MYNELVIIESYCLLNFDAVLNTNVRGALKSLHREKEDVG